MTLTNEWYKATRSGDTNCVEVRKASAATSGDTKDLGNGPALSSTEPEWDAVIDGAKGGRFDL
jgi:hypothetical protein